MCLSIIEYFCPLFQGCDGSILLDSTKNNTAEKDTIPNLSLVGLEKNNVKRIVSCADILALAARDAVSFLAARHAFKKSLWEAPTGRKDGNVSRDTEALANLPSPFSVFSTLRQSFANKGLNVRDLVVLSGGHTIGIGLCNLFSNRLCNFIGRGDQDPSSNSTYAVFLKAKCSRKRSRFCSPLLC
ncbi:unnamed protein product [Coffea canephora]|uniref:peroxidase n=1 Tax=Coffea canephora TaxID=49390 RepID=A0A068UM44_COFCA|nr:unnamed protein product [Coffea canephora]